MFDDAAGAEVEADASSSFQPIFVFDQLTSDYGPTGRVFSRMGSRLAG